MYFQVSHTTASSTHKKKQGANMRSRGIHFFAVLYLLFSGIPRNDVISPLMNINVLLHIHTRRMGRIIMRVRYGLH